MHELTVSYTTEAVILGCTCERFSKRVKKLDYFDAKISHRAHIDATAILERNSQ